MLVDWTVFASVTLFLLFLGWGVWKRPNNPRLFVAIGAGVILAAAGAMLGAVAVGAVAGMFVFGCVLWGVIWLIARLLGYNAVRRRFAEESETPSQVSTPRSSS